MRAYTYTDATGQRWLWPPWELNGSADEAMADEIRSHYRGWSWL